MMAFVALLCFVLFECAQSNFLHCFFACSTSVPVQNYTSNPGCSANVLRIPSEKVMRYFIIKSHYDASTLDQWQFLSAQPQNLATATAQTDYLLHSIASTNLHPSVTFKTEQTLTAL